MPPLPALSSYHRLASGTGQFYLQAFKNYEIFNSDYVAVCFHRAGVVAPVIAQSTAILTCLPMVNVWCRGYSFAFWTEKSPDFLMVKKMYILDDYSAAFTIIKVTLYPIVCFASTRLWIVLADKSCTAGFYFHERFPDLLLRRYISRAIISFPIPLSPIITTFTSVEAI